MGAQESRSAAGHRDEGPDYYELLGVEETATQAEIKVQISFSCRKIPGREMLTPRFEPEEIVQKASTNPSS
jgi:hypothetical protein